MNAQSDQSHLVVIGAGIVGVCCALNLVREGYRVTLVDRQEPGMATSFGNAGSISPSAILPVALPGMLKKLPGWLLDPLGPLTIRWSYLPQILPWLIRFMRHANKADVLRAATAMHELMESVFSDYERLLPAGIFKSLIRRNGGLYVYESEAELEAASAMLDLRRNLGASMEVIGPDEIRQLEPALAKRFAKGVFAENNGSTIDPSKLVNAIADQFKIEGGTVLRADVKTIEFDADRPAALLCQGERIAFDNLVIAAGAWSAKLARQLNVKIPLETQRGYHVTFADPGINVSRTIMWNRRSVFVNPMQPGLRIAGTVELAGLKAEPNMRRADKLATIAADMFPDLNSSNPSNWMGHRPCLPDSLPVIDTCPTAQNVVFAFGHQHVGMCSGASTGRLVADLVSGRQPPIDMSPFSATRF